MDDDAALTESVARLAAGDLSARERILERCGTRLRLLARRMLRRFPEVHRHDDIDDVFQQAALRLHDALGDMPRRGETPRSIMALAATQVRRTLLDLARRNRGPWSHAANHDTNIDAGGGHHVERLTDSAVEPSFSPWSARKGGASRRRNAAARRLPPPRSGNPPPHHSAPASARAQPSTSLAREATQAHVCVVALKPRTPGRSPGPQTGRSTHKYC
jgi:DNA-directed RNA polymerase specialized sigma24 family protein